MKKALVVVDMQNDFLTGALGSSEAAAILPIVAERIREAKRRGGEDVYFTRDTHDSGYLSTQEGRRLPVTHCVKGTAGWQIADGLDTAGGRILDKSAFASTMLAEVLSQEAYSQVTFCGVCTDVCVISNAVLVKAFLPEAEIRVEAAACAGVTPVRHATALAAMRACQIEVI